MADELNEGEFLNELSRRLAHSTKRIRAIYDGQLATENNDPWRLNYKDTDRNIVTSPGGDISNHVSPRYEEAVNRNIEATELLYAAAEEATSLQRRITGTGVFSICALPPKPISNQQFMQQQSTKKKQKGYVASGLLPSAWPKQKNSHFHEVSVSDGSEIRAVFLGNQVTNGERSGTGVFLPRQAGSWNKHSPEIVRKKPDYTSHIF
ncbi:uncharacterized protein LOC108213553 isoform X1 [Daucus carota subsp. sativus]|uniref:uncharacterized protein LOC108213553 isoform X1 n=1 Tax=Daucus carota subsp. sativus TaxID=79200 RepID=UPI0007EF7F96|nr:PREDICTED: uncharacterized protein LOC108213553 isoform X1 [Daucus carota subsp. sativus]